MEKNIGKTGKAVLNPALLFMVLVVVPAHLIAQDEIAENLSIQETHALIEEMILDEPILQNYWHKMDFPQYNHFDEAVWSVVKYSGDQCQITYRRKMESSHKAPATVKPIHGDKPATIIGYKMAKFDMAEVEAIEIHDYGDGRGSIPSVGIRFVVPTAEWQSIGRKPEKIDVSKDPILSEDNAISVLAKDSQRILSAFQHLQGLCQVAEGDDA
jgi:hypothetical protein